ncbi:hypothetical protein P5673_016119 [Acropora cervicornis]|uniref:Uncharacterized protein n=1 Tax=Acropora cervicornis TaxID=6130 RepID=A0AAD9QGR3_ACRCE|nr:hypothetical protein P5673_016119 [Acropora cervicornis]
MAPIQSNSLLPFGPLRYVLIVNLTIKYRRPNHGVGCQSKDPMLHMICKLENCWNFITLSALDTLDILGFVQLPLGHCLKAGENRHIRNIVLNTFSFSAKFLYLVALSGLNYVCLSQMSMLIILVYSARSFLSLIHCIPLSSSPVPVEGELTILKGTACFAIPPASRVLFLTVCFAIDLTSTKGDTLCFPIPTFSETVGEDHKNNAPASGLNKFGNILCPIALTAILMFGNLSEYINGFTELGNKMDMN